MPRKRMELFVSSRTWIDPKQRFTIRNDLVPPSPSRHFKYPARHRTAPATKNYPVQNVSNAEIVKL